MTALARNLASILCGLLVLLSAAGEASAQQPTATEPTLHQVESSDDADVLKRRLTLARKLMGEQQFEGAAAVLETLYEDYRHNENLYRLLTSCYLQLQQLDKAEELTRRYLETYPGNSVYLIQLAEILARKSDRQGAEGAYRQMLDALPPSDVQTFEAVIRSMMTAGFSEMAIDVIDDLRAASRDSTAFALERGKTMEEQKRYAVAAREYLGLLEDSTRRGNEAEKRLLALLEFEGSSSVAEATLLSATGEGAAVYRLLAMHCLRAERFDQAFEYAILEDSLAGLSGKTLLSFMRTCHERRLFPQAVRLGEYLIKHYPNKPVVIDARYRYAEALAKLGRLAEAIAAYDTIASTFPRIDDKAEALSLIGQICMDQLRDYQRALDYFDSVVQYYPKGLGYLHAMLSRPYCYLKQGDLDDADSLFGQLLGHHLSDEVREEVQYHRALIRFWRKDMDSTNVALNRIIVEYPRGLFVNDVIRLLMVMEDAQEAPELLDGYSQALLAEQMLRYDAATAKLIAIVEAENQALADAALYRLIGLSLARPDSARALVHIRQLEQEYGESYYMPFGLKIKADIRAVDPETAEEAKEIYRLLLEQYPNYPFIPEARNRLRELESDSRIG